MVDVGGHKLAYWCAGSGSPTVILEAGYAGGGTFAFMNIESDLAATTRVCTYDRAGTGYSDPRPTSLEPVTGVQMAKELHAALEGIGVKPPYVLVGHSFGGMIVRSYAATYPDEVVGLGLIDAASEMWVTSGLWGLHRWVDNTSPIDMDAMVRQLQRAPPLGDMPLAVITAGVFAAREKLARGWATFQSRLATLSGNSIHVLAKGSGHAVQQEDPALVLATIRAVVEAARSGSKLPPCAEVEANITTAECLSP